MPSSIYKALQPIALFLTDLNAFDKASLSSIASIRSVFAAHQPPHRAYGNWFSPTNSPSHLSLPVDFIAIARHDVTWILLKTE
jgi:hypothetical protein